MNLQSINFGCHKIPDRCFSYKGRPMPFCSRCLGCGIGHIIAFFLFLLGRLPNLIFAALFILPLALDWSIQEFIGIMSNNYRRLVTGILGGLGVGIFIWKFVLVATKFFSGI